MNDNDYNKIADLVDERINRALEPVKNDLTTLKQDLSGVRENLKAVKVDLTEVKEIQEGRVLPSVTYIEKNIKAYKDAYQINDANGKRLEKRVKMLKDKVGITSPPELVIAELP